MRKLIILLFATSLLAYQSITIPGGGVAIQLTVPASAPFNNVGGFPNDRIAIRLDNFSPPTSSVAPEAMRVGRWIFYYSSTNYFCADDFLDTIQAGNYICLNLAGLSHVVVRFQRTSTPVRQGSSLDPTIPWIGSVSGEALDLSTGNVLAPVFGTLNLSTGAFTPSFVATPPAQAGAMKTASASSVSGTLGFIGQSAANYTFSIAWMKWFSTNVPSGAPFETESTVADLGDFVFEGNSAATAYVNTASSGVTLTHLTSDPTFGVATSVLSPICALSPGVIPPVSRAGYLATLPNYSFPLDSTQTLSYAWTQTSGPNTLTLSSTTAANPTFSNGIFGDYLMALTITDGSTNTASCSIDVGSVVTDNNNIAQISDPNVKLILGPQAMLGTNPWLWFDVADVQQSDFQWANFTNSALYNYNSPLPWTIQAGSGAYTVTVTNGSGSFTGNGGFYATFCATAAPCTYGSGGTNCIGLCTTPPYISVWYPSATIPGGYGKHSFQIGTITSDTTGTFGAGTWNSSGSSLLPPGTYNYSYLPGAFVSIAFTNIPGPADFYDPVLSEYAKYYRSGLTTYLTRARARADYWWILRFDSGNCMIWNDSACWTDIRNQAQQGLYLRAIDQGPSSDMWRGLEQVANYGEQQVASYFSGYGNWNGNIGGCGDGADARTCGYALMAQAFCALFCPIDPVNGAAAAATARASMSVYFNDGWNHGYYNDTAMPGNYFYSFTYGGEQQGNPGNKYASATAGTGGITLQNGTSTGTCVNGTPLTSTFTNGSASIAGTNTFLIDQAVQFTTTGSLPTGFAVSTTYYVLAAGLSTSHFELAATVGGSAIVAGSAGSGTQTAFNVCQFDSTMFATGVWWWFTNSSSALPNTPGDGDPDIYYAKMTSPSTVQFYDITGITPVSYTDCPSGAPCIKGYLAPMATVPSQSAVGFVVQPYMYGILGTAFDYAGKALACTSAGVPINCDNTNSANAYTYNQATATFQRLYSFWPLWGGAYYYVGAPGCSPPISDTNGLCVEENPSFSSLPSASKTRTLNMEAMRGVMTAYAHGHDSLLKTFGDQMYGAMWARGGYNSLTSYDLQYITDFEPWYGSYTSAASVPTTGAPKYYGMMAGISAQAAWPGYRLSASGGTNGLFPLPMPVGTGTSITNYMTWNGVTMLWNSGVMTWH